MITPEMIQRINELAKKKKTVGLSEKEAQERAELHRIYLNNIKTQMVHHLDRIELVDKPVTKAIH